jgi:rubrerythrin
MEETTVQEVLEFAKLSEEVSRAHYQKGIEIVELDSAKKFLKELADEEQDHIARLTSLQKKITLEKNVPKVIKPVANINAAPLNAKEKLEKDSDFMDIIRIAMSHEKEAIQDYSQFAESVAPGEVQDLFILLANEERGHLRKFENAYDDFTDEMSHDKIQELIIKMAEGF